MCITSEHTRTDQRRERVGGPPRRCATREQADRKKKNAVNEDRQFLSGSIFIYRPRDRTPGWEECVALPNQPHGSLIRGGDISVGRGATRAGANPLRFSCQCQSLRCNPRTTARRRHRLHGQICTTATRRCFRRRHRVRRRRRRCVQDGPAIPASIR